MTGFFPPLLISVANSPWAHFHAALFIASLSIVLPVHHSWDLANVRLPEQMTNTF